MTKKHPSSRRERLYIKEIKDAKRQQASSASAGRLRRKDTEENGYGLEGLEVPRPEEETKERTEPVEGNTDPREQPNRSA